MAGLSVLFKGVDEISAKFDSMANAGARVLERLDEIEDSGNAAMNTITEQSEEAAKSIERASTATDYWTDKIGTYDKACMEAVYTTQELVDQGYKTEDALEQEIDAIQRTQEEMEQLGSEMDKTQEEMEQLGKETDKTSEEMEKLGKKTQKTSEDSEEFGKKSCEAVSDLDELLATAGILLALGAIANGFEKCSEAASEFERNSAMVSTVADSTILTSDQISAQITELSNATGKSVNELAEASYNAISAGVNTADAVGTVGEATMLAEAGFTSSTSALSVLTTAMNAYQMEATEITNISDSLVMSQNLGVLTIDQMASSMGKAISTASAYNVGLYNLESGYISLTKAGISVEESTTYISSMMNELGAAGTAVADILQAETGKTFGQLMKDGYSLSDVLEILYNDVNQNSEAFMNLWGSAEAGKAGNAIINQGLEQFNTNLGLLSNSAGTTEKAYEAMTDTTTHANERMSNSLENLSIAIGDDLNPAISDLQNEIADATDDFAALIQKHPAISATLAGITVGVGAVTLGVTAYIAISKIATAATAVFGTTLNAAIWPATLLVGAIAGVTAAFIYFSQAEDEAEKAQQSLTSSSEDMSREIEVLQSRYDELTEAGEADTVAAYELRNEIDELTTSFENNKQTIGDLLDINDRLKSTIEDIANTYDEAQESIDLNESTSKSLIAQLVSMSDEATLTGDQLGVMQGIVDKLNGSYENLNLTLDETNGSLNLTIEELWGAVSEAAETESKQANMDALMDYLGQYQQAQQVFDEANKSMNDAYADYEKAVEENFGEEHPFLAWTGLADGAEMNWGGTAKDMYNIYKAAKEATEGASENFDMLDESIRACYESMGYSSDEINEMMGELALASASATELEESMDTLQDTSSNTVSSEEAVAEAVSGVQAELTELATAYDNAYASARESIDGQIGLFEAMTTESEQSVEDMQSALDSQVEYLNTYIENMEKASEYGLSEGLLESLSDGSAESAGQLDAIIQKVEELGGTTEEAKTFVSEFNTSFEEVQTAKDSFATTVAKMQTDFEAAMEGINTKMEQTISNMDMSSEAASAANKTMNAYISAIKSKITEANNAMAALNFANSSTAGLNGYATGTLDAEPGLALVGENGPELVNFGGGEVVYTADETANILSRDRVDGTELVVPQSGNNDVAENSGDKTITLKIEGSGEMKVGGSGASKEDILAVMVENVKGVLLSIIEQEILEEGEMSYEF